MASNTAVQQLDAATQNEGARLTAQECHLLALPREIRDMIYDSLRPKRSTISVNGKEWTMAHPASSLCQQLRAEVRERMKKQWLKAATKIKATVTDFDCSGLVSVLENGLKDTSVAKRTLTLVVRTTKPADQYEDQVDEWFRFLAKDPDMKVLDRRYEFRGFVSSSEAEEDLLDDVLDRAYERHSRSPRIHDYAAMVSALMR